MRIIRASCVICFVMSNIVCQWLWVSVCMSVSDCECLSVCASKWLLVTCLTLWLSVCGCPYVAVRMWLSICGYLYAYVSVDSEHCSPVYPMLPNSYKVILYLLLLLFKFPQILRFIFTHIIISRLFTSYVPLVQAWDVFCNECIIRLL